MAILLYWRNIDIIIRTYSIIIREYWRYYVFSIDGHYSSNEELILWLQYYYYYYYCNDNDGILFNDDLVIIIIGIEDDIIM